MRLHQSLDSIASLSKDENIIHQKYMQLVKTSIYEERFISSKDEYETLKKSLIDKEFELSNLQKLLKSQFPVLESGTTFIGSINSALYLRGISAGFEPSEVIYDRVEFLEVRSALKAQLEESRKLLIEYIDESQKAVKYLNDPSFEYDRWDFWYFDEHKFIADVLRKSPPLKKFDINEEGISSQENLRRIQAEYYISVVQDREVLRGLYEDGSNVLRDFSVNTALTIGTAGLGTGIAQARTAIGSIRAGNLYKISKTELVGIAILGSNSAWTALSFRESYSICNQAFKIKEIPIGLKASKDVLNSLGKNFVNDYQSCIIGVAFNSLDFVSYIPPFAKQFMSLKAGQTTDLKQLERANAVQLALKEKKPIGESFLLNGRKLVSSSGKVNVEVPKAKFILSKASNGYNQFVPIKLFDSIPEKEEELLELFATILTKDGKDTGLRGAKAIVDSKTGRIVLWKGDSNDPHHLGITGKLYAEQHPKEFQQFQEAEALVRPGYVKQEGYTHDFIDENFKNVPELSRYYGYELTYDKIKKEIYFKRSSQLEQLRSDINLNIAVNSDELF